MLFKVVIYNESMIFIVTTFITLTLLGAGGGGIRPPYHTFVIPRKKLMGKVANFFLLFLNM